MSSSVLIVEDDELFAHVLSRIVAEDGFEPIVVESGEEALKVLDQVRPALVLCDLGLPGMDGIAYLEALAKREPALVSIVVSGQATVERAAAAMRAGAFDVLQKTSDPDEIQLRLRRAMETVDLKRQVAYLQRRESQFAEIVGESPAMLTLRQRIEDVARSPAATVLIVGETGTGKELVARAVHRLSMRRKKPLVAINGAAIPESLIESEFFGHERGAYTGASRARAGLFEMAQGSTLFLDEIGELDLRLQAKLLRVLEERVLRRVGGSRDIKVDVRFISATNRDLTQEIAAGRFREDLYYRVNVFRIDVPPLRDRGNDVLLLARHFLSDFTRQLGKPISSIHREAEQRLGGYSFPGNVRQLRNLIEQAVILARGVQITPDQLIGIAEESAHVAVPPVGKTTSRQPEPTATLGEQMNALEADRAALDRREMKLVRAAMSEARGKVTGAAKLLGISRFALQRRLKRMKADAG